MNSDRWLSCEVEVSQLSEQVSGNISVSPSLDIDVPWRTSRREPDIESPHTDPALLIPVVTPSGITSSDRCTVMLFCRAPNSAVRRERPDSESCDVEFDFSPIPPFPPLLAVPRFAARRFIWMFETAVSLRLPSFFSESHCASFRLSLLLSSQLGMGPSLFVPWSFSQLLQPKWT